MTQKFYKNHHRRRNIKTRDGTWYYLGQLAEQMGMTVEDYAEFALQLHVQDRHNLVERDRKWKAP